MGFKGRRGHSLDETVRLGPERAPWKAQALAADAPVASQGSHHGALSCLPGPQFTAGECLLQRPWALGH